MKQTRCIVLTFVLTFGLAMAAALLFDVWDSNAQVYPWPQADTYDDRTDSTWASSDVYTYYVYLPAVNKPPMTQPGVWTLEYQAEPQHRLWEVDALSEEDVWAVGGWCCNPSISLIAHFDGQNWQEVDHPGNDQLFALDMFSSDLGWAAGQFGELLQYENGQWTRMTSPVSTDFNIDDLTVSSASNVWAVANAGASCQGNWKARILHFNGTNWDVTDDYYGVQFKTVNFIAENVGYVGGYRTSDYEQFGPILLKFQNGNWVEMSSPSSGGLKAVDFSDANNGWILSTNEVFRYDDGRWQNYECAFCWGAYAIDTSSSFLKWMSGYNFLGYLQADTWHQVSTPGTDVIFEDIDILPSGVGWAVGWDMGNEYRGMILHHQ